MVELTFVNQPRARRLNEPIGVLAALATGFDRIAARPLLLLPPVLLDLFLWLGPTLRVSTLTAALAQSVAPPQGADTTMIQQANVLRQALTEWGAHFNLFAALRSIPVGVPSLMAGRMPLLGPTGAPQDMQLSDPPTVLGLWLGLTFLGLGLGSLYHLWAARQVAPGIAVPSAGRIWLRMAVLALAAWLAAVVLLFALLVMVTVVTVLLPSQTWIGMVLAFAGFSLLFWLAVYLVFSPHGIVRYGLGVLHSIVESVRVVRWNLLGTTVFLALAVGISWLTNWVWNLPGDTSWYNVLAVLGHAFVSATLLVGSYAFYQSRRDWTLRLRGLAAAAPTDPSQTPRADA